MFGVNDALAGQFSQSSSSSWLKMSGGFVQNGDKSCCRMCLPRELRRFRWRLSAFQQGGLLQISQIC